MNQPDARFVAVARARYAQLATLPKAVTDAQQLGQLLKDLHQFQTVVLADLPRGELLDAFEAQLAPSSATQGAVIVLWTGHGERAADGSLQLMGMSGSQDVVVATPARLGELAAQTGARQVLLLIDTCFAASALVDASRLANAVVGGRATPGVAWFAVLAASLADEPALAGALARALMQLLQHGPREPDLRWSRKHAFIRGDDLVQALLKDWDEPRHTPFQMSFGRAWDLVRNPLHEQDLADQPVEHLLHAARGSAGEESFFTGREAPLARLVAWLTRETPGLMVITGPPGCGKSAVLGRIVSLSSPAERARLLAAAAVPMELDPGAGRVDLQLQARGATVESAALALARQLGVDPAQGRWGVLAEASARRLQGRPLTVAVDGLDEARGATRELAMELLQPLSRESMVLIATREVHFVDTTLITLLGAAANAEVLDLGADPAATLRDMRNYVIRRLTDVAATMDPEQVADELIRARADSSAPFLLARLITSQLLEHPVDTSQPDWRLVLSRSVESALERDMQGVVLTIDGQPQPQAARELLRALALSHGSGFPADDVWPAVATALSSSGIRYGREQAYAVLTALGRHIVASNEATQPVYRIAHQQLVDYLAASASFDAAQRAAPALSEAVAGAIADTYNQWLDDGGAPRAHAYLWRTAWRHLAEGGAAGLARLAQLAERDPEAFDDDYAKGCEFAGEQARSEGRVSDALVLHERAVALRRRRADPLQLAMSLFQLSITHLVLGDEESAEEAAVEAAEVARPVRDDANGRVVLAAALIARALTQLREGNFRLARRLIDELIALEPEGARDEDAWRRMSSAYVVASLSSMFLNDLAEAERFGRLAAELCRSDDRAREEPLIFLDAHSTLAAVLCLRAAFAAPDEHGRLPAVDLSIGQAVLEMYQRRGRRGDMGDTITAKGLMYLVRSRLLNLARGWADDAAAPPVLELLEHCIALSRGHAGQVVDAALMLGAVLSLRAQLLSASDLAAAVASADEAIGALHPFASTSRLVGIELGIALDARTSLELPRFIANQPIDVDAASKRQEEAISLLRSGVALPHRLGLAGALSRLSLLVQVSSPERAAAAREEAIAVLRDIAGDNLEARTTLVSNLVDQVAYLATHRIGEAVEIGHEALRLARSLPAGPHTTVLVGVAEVNLCGALVNFEQLAGVETMLEEALERLRPAQDAPICNAVMGAALITLSQLQAQDGRFDSALVHAREARRRLAAPDLPAFAALNQMSALAVLGRAERGSGAVEQGTATLRQLIDQLREVAHDGGDQAVAMVMAINLAAPDLWDDAITALGDQPQIVRRLTLMRFRPRAETATTVRMLIDALASAPPGELRETRQIARAQRSRAVAEFEQAWRELAGDVPEWLRVDSTVEWAAIGWWNAPTWPLSRDYLAAHPVLLDARTDLVLEEFAFGAEDRTLVDRHLALLAATREQGVEVAFGPTMLDVEIHRWMESDEFSEHLAQHPELLRAELLARLRENAAAGDGRAQVLAAIVELAQRGEADLAIAAAEYPPGMGDELRAGCRSSDVSRLHALATIVVNLADGAPRRQAALALAIVTLVQPDAQPLSDELRESIVGSEPDERVGLTAMITDSIAQHPKAAATLVTLLPLVSSPQSDASTHEAQ